MVRLRQSLERRDPLYRIIREVLTAQQLIQGAVGQHNRWHLLYRVGLSTDAQTHDRFVAFFTHHVPALERSINQCLALCSIRHDMKFDPHIQEDAAFSLAGLHSDTTAELKRLANDTHMNPQRALEDIEQSVAAFRTLERELQSLIPH